MNVSFLAEFIQKPFVTGSLIPSSSHLARRIVDGAQVPDADVVLEYGPGTGAVTEYILEELQPHAQFAAIEINPQFAAMFRSEYPGIRVFEDSAENVRAICDSMQVQSVDCVISGLPWALFPQSLQVSMLDQMMSVLRPGGRFATFEYVHSMALPAQRKFARLLPDYFNTVSKSPIEWRNLPPAFVFHCRR